MEFKPAELSDREEIEPLLINEGEKIADFCFSNLIIWSHSFRASWAKKDGLLFVRMGYGSGNIFLPPIGGPLSGGIKILKDECGGDFRICCVSEKRLEEFERCFGGEFSVTHDDWYSDYIYDAEQLADLKGRKLASKRNHINYFEKTYEWRAEEMSPENIGECRAFAEWWAEKCGVDRGEDYSDEIEAENRFFDNFGRLATEGLLLRSNGKVFAFTAGDMLSDDTFLSHFEKADPDMRGAYAIINREFARYIRDRHPNVRYINREEDMGLESLRAAKQSYYPAMMGVKYTLTWKK